jgi:hypothetical protein
MWVKHSSERKFAWFRINMNCMFASKFVDCRYIFCRRLIVFHLPCSQRQMKRNPPQADCALCAFAVKNIANK